MHDAGIINRRVRCLIDLRRCPMRTLILAITLLMLASPILQTAAASPDGVSALAGTRCELVELYPGYPGYAGYVTGVDGIGDHACLEDLERQNPDFDREYEDDQNFQGARSLGINGGPGLWTWENWMAIEDARGMEPTCYTCLYDPNNARPNPTTHSIQPDDPRLLAGAFQSHSIWTRLSNELGLGSGMEPYDDYWFQGDCLCFRL